MPITGAHFCTTVRMFGRGYRERSPKNVVDEMEYLHKRYGASQFTFYDDAFTVNQKRTIEICNEIHRRGLTVEWDCETRVDMITKELLETMKSAGCIAVWFGENQAAKASWSRWVKASSLTKQEEHSNGQKTQGS